MHIYTQNIGYDVPFYWYVTTEDALCQSQLVWSISGSPWFSLAPANDHVQVAQWISYATIYPTTSATLSENILLISVQSLRLFYVLADKHELRFS